MSHAYTNLILHVVFATKDRAKTLTPEIQRDLYPYMIALAKEKEASVEAIGGGLEHVHVLVHMPAKLSVADLVKFLKSNSSRWLKERIHMFAWQPGYAAFSVSHSKQQDVRTYVREQEAHHRKHDFEAEFVGLLRKNEIQFDERLWAS